MEAEDNVIPVAVRAWIAFAASFNLGIKSYSIDFQQSLNRRLQCNDFYSVKITVLSIFSRVHATQQRVHSNLGPNSVLFWVTSPNGIEVQTIILRSSSEVAKQKRHFVTNSLFSV